MSEAVRKPAGRAKPANAARKPGSKQAGKKPSRAKKAATAKKRTQAKKPSAAKKPNTAKKPSAANRRTQAGKAGRSARRAPSGRTTSVKKVSENPVAIAANRRLGASGVEAGGDLFMERRAKKRAQPNTSKTKSKSTAASIKPKATTSANKSKSAIASGKAKAGAARSGKKKTGGTTPPRRPAGWLSALNLGLIAAIALLLAFGIRQHAAYAEFRHMRDVVDQQTFYEGTTVEGVDVSNMTLSNAMEYWRERVEARNAARAVTFDDGTTVTAGELGYASDYESVLYAAWSAGRNGSLEERYLMAAHRVENPVAYAITRRDYSPQRLEEYVQGIAEQVNRPATEASIAAFDTQTYEFQFNPATPGAELDADALKAAIVESIRGGGGSVTLPITVIQPQVSTANVASQYGLIDYAITNASSSSKSRINNIVRAMSFINGTCVRPGETFSFNDTVGQRTAARGFKMATAYSGGDVTEDIGGGICQVSTTLFNAAVKADMEIVERHNHSLTVHYVDKGKDATVDWGHQDFKFRNTSSDNVYICCYLTDDKRVRFGIFGKLLPNGEKITLESRTTEVVKAQTEYQPSSFLGPGQTYVLQEGRNGYKAEAYKVRWDAAGNEISRELLCKSVYKMKNEIIQYGT